MYPRMAQEAREEGFTEIAQIFEGIAEIEREHEERYKKLLDNIVKDVVFKKNIAVQWKCRNCGYKHEGVAAPETCPVVRTRKRFLNKIAKNTRGSAQTEGMQPTQKIECGDEPYSGFSGWGKLQQGMAFNQLTSEEKNIVGQIDQLCNQFVEADKYVFVTPMWNLSIPLKMKAYIDTLCIAGKTFAYTEAGPVGLLTNKKAVHIQARGGVYSEGPAQGFEFGDRYIRAILTFLGVPSIESVIAEGMNQTPEKAEEIKVKALGRALEVAGNF